MRLGACALPHPSAPDRRNASEAPAALEKGSTQKDEGLWRHSPLDADTGLRPYRIMLTPPKPMGRSDCWTTQAPAGWSQGTDGFIS